MKDGADPRARPLVTPSGPGRHYGFLAEPRRWRASQPIVMGTGKLHQLMRVVNDVRRRPTSLLTVAETEPSTWNKKKGASDDAN